jgi:hypothetical protein
MNCFYDIEECTTFGLNETVERAKQFIRKHTYLDMLKEIIGE